MKNTIRIAALILGGVVFIGCDKKDNTTSTTPNSTTPMATPAATPATSPIPGVPDATTVTNKANDMIDQTKKAATDEKNKLEGQLQNNMPTTNPLAPK